MRKLLFLIFLCFPIITQAQYVRVGPNQISQQTTVGNVTNALTIPTGALVQFCNYPANAVPCTDLATTYTGPAGFACLLSTQIVLDGTSTCVATPDAQENWGVWVPAGNYQFTITIPGSVALGPYTVSAGGAAGGTTGGGIVNSLLTATSASSAVFTVVGIPLGNGGAPVTSCAPYVVKADTTGGSATTLDRGSVVEFNSSSACAVTLPDTGSTGMGGNFVVKFRNVGAGAVTINRGTTSTFSMAGGGAAGTGRTSFTLGQWAYSTCYGDNSSVWRCDVTTDGIGVGVDASTFPGATWTAKVNSAVSFLSTGGGTITVPDSIAGDGSGTNITLNNNDNLTFTGSATFTSCTINAGKYSKIDLGKVTIKLNGTSCIGINENTFAILQTPSTFQLSSGTIDCNSQTSAIGVFIYTAKGIIRDTNVINCLDHTGSTSAAPIAGLVCNGCQFNDFDNLSFYNNYVAVKIYNNSGGGGGSNIWNNLKITGAGNSTTPVGVIIDALPGCGSCAINPEYFINFSPLSNYYAGLASFGNVPIGAGGQNGIEIIGGAPEANGAAGSGTVTIDSNVISVASFDLHFTFGYFDHVSIQEATIPTVINAQNQSFVSITDPLGYGNGGGAFVAVDGSSTSYCSGEPQYAGTINGLVISTCSTTTWIAPGGNGGTVPGIQVGNSVGTGIGLFTNDLVLQVPTGAQTRFDVNGTPFIYFGATHLSFQNDNAYAFGSANSRISNVFVGGQVAWSNGASVDTTLCRNAAGIVETGTTACNASGISEAALHVSNGGTACANGNFALSGGWGSTASVSGAAGFSQTCQMTISSSGSGEAANATITWTLPTALPAATTVCTANLVGGTITGLAGTGILLNNTTLSATAPIFTFAGLPVAGTTTIIAFRCGP
jgi:hypothetical protein